MMGYDGYWSLFIVRVTNDLICYMVILASTLEHIAGFMFGN